VSKNGDGGDELSADLQSLFRSARRAHDPTAADRARIDEVIASKLNGEVLKATGASTKLLGTRAFTVHGVMNLSLGIVCVAAASLAMMHWRDSRSVVPPMASGGPSNTPAIAPPAPAPMPEVPVIVEPVTDAKPSRFESAPAPATKLERRKRRRVQSTTPARPSAEARSTTDLSSTNASSRPSPKVEAQASDVQSDTTRAPSATAASAPISAEPARAEQPVDLSSARAADVAARADDPELMLVTRMHAALRQGDFSAALALCAEHERRWPHGVFELEREGVRAIASCGANTNDAASRAKRFLSAHPHTPVAMRVSSACAAQLPKR
jgi:hypothetical protein